MATNKLLDRLDREYEVYALKKQLDEVFRRFVDPDTFESRQPSEIEEMLEEFKKTLPKAVAEVLLLWLEVEYWPLEDAVCRILFVDPEAAPQTYAYVCRWLKADIKSNKIDAEEVGGQLCLTASPLIEWALESRHFPKMTSRNFILQVCSNVMRRLPATACVDRHQAQPQPEDFALTRTKAINLYRGEFPTVSREAAGARIDRARKAGHILSTGTGKARRLDLTSFYAWLYGECHDPKREADMQTIPPGKPPDRM